MTVQAACRLVAARRLISSTAAANTSHSTVFADRLRSIAEQSSEPPLRTVITGGLGQLGRALADALRAMYGESSVLLTDVVRPTSNVGPFRYLDVLDERSLDTAIVEHRANTLVHYSALLSAVGEADVRRALAVNVDAVQRVLEVSRRHNLKLFLPSTMGAFGPDTPRVQTPDVTVQRPRTIYGVSKVFAERLGEYYQSRYGVDFRSLRFPGIISAVKPGGGTTDYAIAIFYDALTTGHHECFLRADTRLPMMYGTDCTASVVQMLHADSESLKLRTYNVTSFSFTPAELASAIQAHIPDFRISYKPCPLRQAIAESWPESMNDDGARCDWGWRNSVDLQQMVALMLEEVGQQIAASKSHTSSTTEPIAAAASR